MATPIRQYLKQIEKDLVQGQATEHTHRPTLKALLESVNKKIVAINEPKRIACGAPDLVVLRNDLTVGYVEAKDVGKPLDEIAQTDQLNRYRKALDNLILTDYLTFIWFVDGKEYDRARVATQTMGGKLDVRKDGVAELGKLLDGFLAQQPQDITSPQVLAERMAKLTRLIRDIVVNAFQRNEASPMLTDLRLAMAQALIPDMNEPEQLEGFADMYAQTLAYGLFAARANFDGPGEFRRRIAAESIPKTNPFLRRLFTAITGPDLNDEPYAGFVKDLVQLLNHSDFDTILAHFGKRTRQEDPVVHFYESFLAKYNPDLREKRGVYYTPEPVVSFIVRSVDLILRDRFDLPGGLADESMVTYTRDIADVEIAEEAPRVLVLDPATGTATFLYYVVDLIREKFMKSQNAGMWPGYVQHYLLPRLFGFELLMAPYTVAHLKLGLQLDGQDLPAGMRDVWRYDFSSSDRLGIYLTNTLEQAEKEIQTLYGPFRAITEEGKAAASVKRDKPIMVVLGNPPYSGHSANQGEWIDGLLKGELPDGESTASYYKVAGKPLGERNTKWLQDDYVKFVRWGQWRIQKTGKGVMAFITNHGYLDNPTFKGMRWQLMQAFSDIYILNLHGNSRKGEVAPDGSPDENVFDIQQGVAIGIFIKDSEAKGPARIHYKDLWRTRKEKYTTLAANDISSVEWEQLEPVAPLYLFTPQDIDLRDEYTQGWNISEAMPVNGVGMNTHRDGFAIAFEKATVEQRISDLTAKKDSDSKFKKSDSEIRQLYGLNDTYDFSLEAARSELAKEASDDVIINCVYRPFDFRFLIYHPTVIDRHRPSLNKHLAGHDNISLVTTRQTREQFAALVVDKVCGQHKIVAKYDGSYIFPLYLYTTPKDTEGTLFPVTETTREPNFSPGFLDSIRTNTGLQLIEDGNGDLDSTFGPEDALHYIYAVLSSPTYRERYSDFLKVNYPRVPITSDKDLFAQLANLGEELVLLHTMKSPILAKADIGYPVPGNNKVARGYPSYLAPGEPEPGSGGTLKQGRVYINPDQFFVGISPDEWGHQTGGYQVLERWLKERKGRTLTYSDQKHYKRIVAVVRETMRLTQEIDETISEWPIC